MEGGSVVGFPWPIFVQCYGPPLPSGGQAIDPTQFSPVGLAMDFVFWYVVSLVVWIAGLRVFSMFRRVGRPHDEAS